MNSFETVSINPFVNSDSFKNEVILTLEEAEVISRLTYKSRSGGKGFAEQFSIYISPVDSGDNFQKVTEGSYTVTLKAWHRIWQCYLIQKRPIRIIITLNRKQFYIVSHLGLPYLRLTESDNRLELS